MKKTIFLSLVAGAVIFSGCGGGGGGGEGGSSTSSGGSSSSSSSGGASSSSGGNGQGTKTYEPYQYPAETLNTPGLITVNADNTWTITNDAREFNATTVDKTYTQAEQFCANVGEKLPSANDLLAIAKPANTTSLWAAGKFVVSYADNTIGQVANEDANTNDEVRKVLCMKANSDSIEKKHATTENGDIITDVTTGFQWSPFKVYDKGQDVNNTNQFRFPIANAGTTPTGKALLTAAEYCATFGADWELPTLGELRTIIYLDGTTPVKKLDNLVPTVIWTSTQTADGRNYVIKLNANGTHGIEDGDEVTNPGNASFYVTCVKK